MKDKTRLQINKYKELIGLSTLVLFSKEFFPKNADIKPFLANFYNLEFRDYLYKSRTLLVARVNKHIYENLTDTEVTEALKKLRNMFFNNRVDKPKKKSKSGENLNKWLDNI